MTRALLIFVGFCIVLASCTQRMVCPAYQSAFIYDKDQLRKKFSYFENDSTPKIYSASKTKYLIAEPTNYRRKTRSMQTLQARKVPVIVPDSISGKGDADSVITADLDRAARSVIDSTLIVPEPPEDTLAIAEEDSTYVITRDREVKVLKYDAPDSLVYDSINHRYAAQKPKYYIDEVGFNTEQDNYMWYLRHSLVLPDVRLAKMQQAAPDEAEGKKKKGEKKGLFGFFKNLFKKEQPQDIDSAELEIVDPEHQFDFIDTTATEEPERVVTPTRRKQGLLKRNDSDETLPDDQPAINDRKKKKKKGKDKKADQPLKPKEEKKKPEDDDDGF